MHKVWLRPNEIHRPEPTASSRPRPPKVPKSRKNATSDVSSTLTSKPSSGAFDRLPNEILSKILDEVHEIDLAIIERASIRHRKWNLLEKVSFKGKLHSWVYPIHELDPILTSFQSLATVNKKFHTLCCPILWKGDQQNIRFPTFVPVELSHWTKTILPNVGHYVISLTTALSVEWLRRLPQNLSTTRYGQLRSLVKRKSARRSSVQIIDNLARFSCFFDTIDTEQGIDAYLHQPGCLSPESVQNIISLCPNLNHISLEFPDPTQIGQRPICLDDFQRRLIALADDQTSLRKLDLYYSSSAVNPDVELINQILKRLPLLEGFTCSISKPDDQALPHERHSLLSSLSKLQHLSTLSFSGIKGLAGAWEDPSIRSHSLATLSLENCSDISIEHLHSNINSFSPNLTKLEIRFGPVKSGISSGLIELGAFVLPYLQSVALIYAHPYNLVKSFIACKALINIRYCCVNNHQYPQIGSLLSDHTWPELKSLSLGEMIPHFTEAMIDVVSELAKVC